MKRFIKGLVDDLTWAHVDEATGASQGLRGRNLPRAAAAAPNYYARKRKNPRCKEKKES